MDFFDADGLSGKNGAEVNLFASQADAAAMCDDNNLVVERIIDIGQSCVGAGGGLIDFGGALHVQCLVWTFGIEDFHEIIEFGLLLKEI